MKRVTLLLMVVCVLAFVTTLPGCGGDGPRDQTVDPAAKPQPPPPLTNPALALVSNGGVWISDSLATNMRQLTAPKRPAEDNCPAWSPDGTTVAFFRQPDSTKVYCNLYLFPIAGTQAQLVYEFGTDLAYVPMAGGTRLEWVGDDRQFIYDTEYSHMMVLDLRGTSPQLHNLDVELGVVHHACQTPTVGPDLEPATPGFQGLLAYDYQWNPDDTHPTPAEHHAVAVVRIAQMENGSFTLVEGPVEYVVPAWHTHPVFSQQGDRLVYLQFDDSGWHAYTLAVQSSPLGFGGSWELPAARESISWMGDADWSPDGRWISFTTKSNPNRTGGYYFDVYRALADGTGDRVPITSVTDKISWGGCHWNPMWVPDLP